MKKTRLFVAASLLAIGAFSTATMTSCSKDDKICNPGYEGKNCDVESRAKFVKTWNAVDVTPGGTQKIYTCGIANGSNVTSVIISNTFSNNFFDNNINATVSENTITIASQKPDANGDYSVSGSGSYINGQISWNYVILENSTGDKVDLTGTWK